MHGGARMRLRLRPTQGGGSVASWQALKIPQPPCKHASAARSLLRLGCGLLSSREAGERNMATTACAVQPQLRSARQIARAPGRRPQRVFAVATGADLLPTWLLAGRLGAAGMIRRLTEHVDNAPTPTAGPARRQAAPAQPPSPPPAPAPAAQAPPPIKIPRSLEEVDNGQILGFSADLSEVRPPGSSLCRCLPVARAAWLSLPPCAGHQPAEADMACHPMQPVAQALLVTPHKLRPLNAGPPRLPRCCVQAAASRHLQSGAHAPHVRAEGAGGCALGANQRLAGLHFMPLRS